MEFLLFLFFLFFFAALVLDGNVDFGFCEVDLIWLLAILGQTLSWLYLMNVHLELLNWVVGIYLAFEVLFNQVLAVAGNLLAKFHLFGLICLLTLSLSNSIFLFFLFTLCYWLILWISFLLLYFLYRSLLFTHFMNFDFWLSFHEYILHLCRVLYFSGLGVDLWIKRKLRKLRSLLHWGGPYNG